VHIKALLSEKYLLWRASLHFSQAAVSILRWGERKGDFGVMNHFGIMNPCLTFEIY